MWLSSSLLRTAFILSRHRCVWFSIFFFSPRGRKRLKGIQCERQDQIEKKWHWRAWKWEQSSPGENLSHDGSEWEAQGRVPGPFTSSGQVVRKQGWAKKPVCLLIILTHHDSGKGAQRHQPGRGRAKGVDFNCTHFLVPMRTYSRTHRLGHQSHCSSPFYKLWNICIFPTLCTSYHVH